MPWLEPMARSADLTEYDANLRRGGWTMIPINWSGARAVLAAGAACVLVGCSSRVSNDAPALTWTEVSQLDATRAEMLRGEAMLRSSQYPAEPYWPYREGQLLLHLERPVEAEARLQHALTRQDDFGPALTLLSMMYWETGRHEDGVATLEPVVARGNAAPELQAALALHWDALGEYDLSDAVTARVLDGEDADRVSPALTYLKIQADDPEGASIFAERAVQVDDARAENWNNVGVIRLRSGDPLGARRALLRANEIDAELPGPYYNLAILDKYFLFNDREAAAWFAEYWSRSQDDPDGLVEVFGLELAEIDGGGDVATQ
jgi:Flp pilus assembly protein TadD